MKILILISILCIFVATNAQNATINHRGRFFLRNVNEARKILASGFLRQLVPFGLDGIISLPPIGPAANMYRMKWSAELEIVANKSLADFTNKTFTTNPDTFFGNFKTDGYTGFFWRSDLVATVKKVLEKYGVQITFKSIEEALKRFSSAFETLIFIVWAVITFPKSFPIPEGTDIGPSEALYAHRYEMGCAFDEIALCIMRDTVNNGTLYVEGVACTKCPTHCEFRENIDGTIEEGDLCVPPKPGSALDARMQALVQMQEELDSSASQFNGLIIFVFLIIVMVLRK